MQGYCGRIAIVDLTHRHVDYSTVPDSVLQSLIGGRGLGAAILYRHGRTVEPLAPESPLCMLIGPMTGTDFPLANRLTFIFRSPQTRTLAWANTGGYIAAELKNGGLDGLVLVGRAETPVYLHVKGTSITINCARALWGKGALATTEALQAMHQKARVLAIGPAGEALVPIATVINDKGRASGVRNGVGAVWGSKGLKAVVVDDQPSRRPDVTDPTAYKDLLRGVQNKIRASGVIDSKTGTMAVHGTAIALEALGKHGALPTRNHMLTMHPRYAEMGGRALTEKVLVDRITCTRCPVRCRRVTASQGRFTFHVEGPDYAQLCAFGPNCDLVDVEAVSYLNQVCYDFGLDPIEMGNTIAMLAEATERGLAPKGVAWGDAEHFATLTRQAGMQKGEWSRLGLGAAGAAKSLGLDPLAMSVKGISIQNVDPRPEPAWGLLNATESLGAAAHIWTYGDLVYAMRDVGVEPIVTPESTPGEIADRVKYKQDLVAALDAMTICAFSSYAYSTEDYAAALNFITNASWSAAGLLAAGARIVDLERQYNADCGIGADTDMLPERFLREPVPTGPHAGKVCELAPMLQAYYELRGWPGGKLTADRRIPNETIPAIL
jgi:aldehyde:ferredoxin oxidoreductase